MGDGGAASESGNGSPGPAEQEFDFIATMNKVKDKPCALNRIEIVGDERTKRRVIERELEVVRSAETLEDLMQSLSDAVDELNALDIFKTVDAVVSFFRRLPRRPPPSHPPSSLFHFSLPTGALADPPTTHAFATAASRIARPKIDAGPDHLPNTADVTVTVEEKSGYGLHTGLYVQGSETTAEVSGSIKNFFGYAEEFDLTMSQGNAFSPKTRSGRYTLSWQDNRFLGRKSQLRAQVFRTTSSFLNFSSYSENKTGLGADWVSPGGAHKLGYELAWRELFCGRESNNASREVLQQAGHNLKSSLKHVAMADSREVAGGLVSRGAAIQATTELGGIGLDPNTFRFFREEVEVVAERPVPILSGLETALELRLKAGVLLPWGKGCFDKPTYIGDRFFLGGTGDLRGFWIKGAGPTGKCRGAGDNEEADAAEVRPSTSSEGRQRDALGGDVMFSALAALNFEVPFAPALKQAGIHAHVYGNAGNCVGLPGYGRQALASCARELKEKTRASFGVGLVWSSPIGKLEANYCRVAKAFAHDKWRNGFHFGFSTSNLDFQH